MTLTTSECRTQTRMPPSTSTPAPQSADRDCVHVRDSAPRRAQARGAPAAPAPPPQSPPAPHAPPAPVPAKQRLSCTYCKRYGHTKGQCRKLQTQGESKSNNNSAEVISDNGDKKQSVQSQSFYCVQSRDVCKQNFSSPIIESKQCFSIKIFRQIKTLLITILLPIVITMFRIIIRVIIHNCNKYV